MVHQTGTTSASPYKNGYTVPPGGVLETAEDRFYMLRMHEILNAFSVRAPPYPPTQIAPHLYMGSLRNAEDTETLRQLGVTHVLNVAGTRKFDLRKSPYAEETGITNYLMIPAEDHEHYDMMQHFSIAFDFLNSARKGGGCAFVHCNLGVNRSGCICMGYIMYDQRMHLLEAVELMKAKRLFVLCNKNFRHQLVRYARVKGLLDLVKESTIKEVLARAVKEREGEEEGSREGRPSRRYIRRKHNSDTVVVLSSFKTDSPSSSSSAHSSKEAEEPSHHPSKLDPAPTPFSRQTPDNKESTFHTHGPSYVTGRIMDSKPRDKQVKHNGHRHEEVNGVHDYLTPPSSSKLNFDYQGGVCFNKAGKGSNIYPTIATPGRRRRFISRLSKHDPEEETSQRSEFSTTHTPGSYSSGVSRDSSYPSGGGSGMPRSSSYSSYPWQSDHQSHPEKNITTDRRYSTTGSYSMYRPSAYASSSGGSSGSGYQPDICGGYGSVTSARYSTPSLTPFSLRRHHEPNFLSSSSSYTKYDPLHGTSYKPLSSLTSSAMESAAGPFVSKTWGGGASGSTYAATRSYGHSGASSVISTLPKSHLTRIGSYQQTVLAHHSPSTRLSSYASQYRSPQL